MKSLFRITTLFFFSHIVVNLACAAGMKPETPALFLDEDNREVTINVQNTDASLALLHSSLQTIPEDRENKLIVTPQLARVEGGKKQQVRVILKQGITLDRQHMQRINFISIPADDGLKNRTRILVGQNIPVIISPRGLALNPEPWKLLKWKRSDNIIQIENPSKYIVRLTETVDILPINRSLSLKKTYILPGEKIDLLLDNAAVNSVKAIQIHPVTRYGVLTQPFSITL